MAVRSGQLLVGNPGEQTPRVALRRLNLTPGPAAHSFALRRTPDTQPLLTLQVTYHYYHNQSRNFPEIQLLFCFFPHLLLPADHEMHLSQRWNRAICFASGGIATIS